MIRARSDKHYFQYSLLENDRLLIHSAHGASLTLSLTHEHQQPRIHFAGQSVALHPQQWSDWLPLGNAAGGGQVRF